MTPEEISKLEKYFAKTFRMDGFALRARGKVDDSVEVYLGGEFIGVVYKDDEDPSDISYNFDMAILADDLQGV